ncbi:MAG: hypothetical protein ACE5FN_06845 [Leptospirillia bacterium]
MARQQIKLDDIAFLGRTRAEYARYFNLGQLRPGDRILDAASGACSFTAEMRKAGYEVFAADPLYRLDVDGLAARAEADLDTVCTQLPDVAHNYRWDFYRGVEDLRRHRERAHCTFLTDFAKHPSHYKTCSLPDTGFPDNVFDVSLVSYFLFLYDDRLDYAFHKAALLELARITVSEVQVYPLANLAAERSAHVDALMADDDLAHLSLQLEDSGFEFVKGASERLVIRPGKRSA